MMTTLTIATPAGASPLPGAARGGCVPEGGFAQCLDQAVEREPAAADAAPADNKAAEATTKDKAEAPADDKEPAGTEAPAARPGMRRTVAPTARKAEALPAAGTDAATATQTPAAEPTTGLTGTPADAAAPQAKPADEPALPDVASLLPGWAPPVAAPRTPVAGSATVAVDGAETLAAANVLHGTPSLPDGAEPALASPAARPDLPAANAAALAAPAQPFTLPTPTPEAPRPDSASAAALAQAHVAAPVDSPGFAPALATQVRWLVRDGVQQAQLSLNPAEMGPVTVQIVLDGREARIDFRADLAATRQAIESSLPVLAAALDESGLRLSGGGVHDGQMSRQQQQAMAQGGAGAQAFGRGTVALDDEASLRTTRAMAGPARGLVDLVA